MKRVDIAGLYANRRAGSTVAVVVRKVKQAFVFRHLHVQRSAGLEPVLPIDREAEEIHVELTRLRFENS
jgi:hypothetical protein